MPDVRPSPLAVTDFDMRLEQTEKGFTEADVAIETELVKEGRLGFGISSTIKNWFSAFFSQVWSNWIKWFGWIFKPFVTIAESLIQYASPDNYQKWLDGFISNGWLDNNDAKALYAIVKNAGVMGHTVQILLTVMLTQKIVSAFTDVLGATAIQKMNATYSPTVPDPNAIARVSFIAPELHAKVVEAMKRGGLSQSDIELVFISQYALYPPEMVFELYRRGDITESQLDNRLAELGFTAERRSELKKLAVRIPPLQDVIRYMGKEAFEPDMIGLFGLMADYPAEAEEWAAKQGLDKRWAAAEWVSHWKDLGIEFMLSALHRGIKLSDGTPIDFKFLDRYMGLIEIPPKLREIVVKTAYSPYTRVDVRRMYALGVLDENQVMQSYRDIGYDEEHATNLTKFTILDVEKEQKSLTRSDIESGFKDGDLTVFEAVSYLKDIGYKEDFANYLIYRADLVKQRSERQSKIDYIREHFTGNLIPENQARNDLLALGVTVAKANDYISQWKVVILKNAKLPSKTDLDKFFRQKLINESQYKEEMARLGYNEKYTTLYFDLLKRGVET
jgi:hypothetical protein